MNHLGVENLRLTVEAQKKLDGFKDYAVLHSQLGKIDKELMRAIREPAGFAHALVYGPSGVGKTTMIRQITRRLNEMPSPQSAAKSVARATDNLPRPCRCCFSKRALQMAVLSIALTITARHSSFSENLFMSDGCS